MVFLKHSAVSWNWSLICPSLQGHPFWWDTGVSQQRGRHSIAEGFIVLWQVFIDYPRCQIHLWNVQVNTLHWCSTGSWRKKIKKILKLHYLMHFSCTPNVLESSRDVKHSFFKPQVFGPYSVTTWNLKTTYYPHQSLDEPKILKSQCLKHTQLQGYLPTPISTEINWWIFLTRLKWMVKQRPFSHAWRNHPDAEDWMLLPILLIL